MSDKTVVNELVRMSIDLEIPSGKPTEEALRMALEMLLTGMARAVKHSSDIKYWFPLFFPLEMTLESEQLRWNFRLVARLKNALADEEEK